MTGSPTRSACPDPGRRARCAIYTRKSSDEGLEQDFNSLDAQREACSAYILSQASEGWSELPERPALKRLLADVEAGKIDVIVVYKVDRLSRSLFDFARLVELFEKAQTSFVSITQAFNTTSSMGRLTLNMLLSFAQFEREVTAERIRDKIAASKAKGMWMGGTPPVGYRPDGRSLQIIEEDATLVRTIFRRYLELGNVRLLTEALEAEGVRTPARTALTGKAFGGVPFSRGQIYKLLSCPTYVGEVVHQGKSFKGLHQPIIARGIFEQVQASLAANTNNPKGQGRRTRRPTDCLLAHKVTDEAGEPMLAVHATKGQRRYAYYVSRSVQTGASGKGWRIPARELENAVTGCLADALDDPLSLCDRANLELHAHDVAALTRRAAAPAGAVRAGNVALCRKLIAGVSVEQGRVHIACGLQAVADALNLQAVEGSETFTLTADARLTRTGRAMRLVQGESALSAAPEGALIKLLGQAQLYWRELRKGELDITRLAEREKISAAYITRVLRLASSRPR